MDQAEEGFATVVDRDVVLTAMICTSVEPTSMAFWTGLPLGLRSSSQDLTDQASTASYFENNRIVPGLDSEFSTCCYADTHFTACSTKRDASRLVI